MSETRKPASVGRDALGILLMAVAVLSGVSVVMTMARPVDEAAGFTALFTSLVGGIGSIAGLFLSLGIFVVGVRLWMAGLNDRVGRDLFGVLITTLTLSILVGTFSPELGGRFGALCGASVTRRLTMLVGVPYGLACLLLPVWFFWLRGKLGSRNLAGPSRGPTLAQDLGQTLAPSTRQAADAQDDSGLGSVTPLPRSAAAEPPKPPHNLFKTETRAYSSPSSTRTPAASPYPAPATDARPTDVRLTGGIPAGAQALAPIHVSAVQASTPRSAALSHGSHVDRGHTVEPAGKDLAPAHPTDVVEPQPERVELRSELATAGAGESADRGDAKTLERAQAQEPADEALTTEALELAESRLAEELVETDATELGSGVAAARAPVTDAEVVPFDNRPPQPSWEQPSLFDEPVDAYGTPLSLVDALRLANEATAERLGEAPLDASAEATAATEPPPRGLFDEPLEGADEDDEELDENEDGGDDADELEDEEVAVIVTDDLDEELDDEELDDPPLAPRAEPVATRQIEIAEVVLQPQPRPAPVVEPEPSAAVAEPVVERELGADGEAGGVDDLVYRAGCLFVDRGRVAVSMLQREFGLDFKAATEVLDQLQKAGLIGPYLGGQRRDILLTRDEWAQRVGVA